MLDKMQPNLRIQFFLFHPEVITAATTTATASASTIMSSSTSTATTAAAATTTTTAPAPANHCPLTTLTKSVLGSGSFPGHKQRQRPTRRKGSCCRNVASAGVAEAQAPKPRQKLTLKTRQGRSCQTNPKVVAMIVRNTEISVNNAAAAQNMLTPLKSET